MQISVSYAIKCDPTEIYLLTEGSQKYPKRPQISLLRKREISPAFFDHYCLIDARSTKDKFCLTKFGEQIFSLQSKLKNAYIAKVDTQIEFTCSAEVLEAIHNIAMPAINHTLSIGYFSNEVTGFLTMLRVYMIDTRIDDALFSTGYGGNSGIVRLYDQIGQEMTIDVNIVEPVILNGVFDQLREELIHVVRSKGALIGIYNNDEKGKNLLREVVDTRRILQPKREFDLDSADDHAQTDYAKLYGTILELYPNLIGIITYIKNVRPAQHGEIPLLVADAKSGNKEAYERLIDVHLRSILRHAYYYYQRYGLDIEDLFQEGVLGLQNAIPRYSEQEGTAFGAYSAMWVRQNTLRRVVYQHGVVYVPVHAMEKILQSKAIVSQHECSKCGFDTCLVLKDEIMAMLGCTEAVAELMIALCLPAVSIDNMDIDDDLGVAGYPYILDHEFRDAKICISSEMTDQLFEKVVNDERRELILTSLDELKAREAAVIKQRYGLDGPARTLEEIGMALNVTRERIRQIQAKSERRLKFSKRLQGLLKG